MNKFLICEDDPDMVELLNLYLNSKSYNFEIVQEGSEVLPALQKDNFHLLLLDMNLPDMDGEEVLRRIRNYNEFERLPIVVFSASAKIKKISENLQVTGFLEKPFELSELEMVINQHVS